MKAEWTEKAPTSVKSGKAIKSQGKLLPSNLEKQVSTESYDLSEPKSTSKNLYERQWKGRKTWTVIEKLLESQCGQA